jgi:hypothetical protein
MSNLILGRPVPLAPRPDQALNIQAEPDVTWGKGGIDDWGWTAWVSTDRLPRAEAEAS